MTGSDARWSLPQQVGIDLGRTLFGSLFRLRTEGEEYLPARGGAIVICNHPSYLEPLLLTLVMPRPVTHLALTTPWKYPQIAHFLELFGCIPVSPGGDTGETLAAARDALDRGRLLIVFPEGGVSHRGVMRRFQPGAARLAIEAQCPVIPAAACGSYDAWPQGSVIPKFRPVTFRFGRPLDLARAYGRRRNVGLLKCVGHEMEQAVQRLYTPWDPRNPSAARRYTQR